jgi:4-amino-4-deoxy-L-arabinose transferase-like glycosyltransferase
MKIQKIEAIIFALFLFLVVFLRFSSFFQSGIGPDESIYLLMARSLTEGKPPYTEFFDNKPIGIYVLFSLALLIFGNSVLSIRLAACTVISITCYLLYRLGKVISKNDSKVGLIAGTLYAVLTLGSGGISSDTEIFFAPFVVFAFYLVFSLIVNLAKPINQSPLKLLLIGLTMGIGLQVKQVVIFEFIAILIWVSINLYYLYQTNLIYLFKQVFRCYVILGIGLIAPFALIVTYFIITGHFDDFTYANFYANLVRIGDERWSVNNFGIGFLIQVKSNLLLWLCLFLIPFYWRYSQDITPEEKRNLTYLIIWFAMAFLGVCAPKSFYAHYFLQLLPPLCLLSSYMIIKTVWTTRGIDITKRFLILALILVTPLLNIVYPYFKVGIKSVYFRCVKGIDSWGDSPAIISKYLRERVNPNDYIYVVDYLSVIYFLVPSKVPTKYAYPGFMISPKLAKVAGNNPIHELHSIMNKKPAYIVKVKQKNRLNREPLYLELDRYLEQNYVFDKEFILEKDIFEDSKNEVDIVEVFRLKSQVSLKNKV